MINRCKNCKQKISKDGIPFFKGVGGSYWKVDIFCNGSDGSFHKLLTNLEYLEWCLEQKEK